MKAAVMLITSSPRLMVRLATSPMPLPGISLAMKGGLEFELRLSCDESLEFAKIERFRIAEI